MPSATKNRAEVDFLYNARRETQWLTEQEQEEEIVMIRFLMLNRGIPHLKVVIYTWPNELLRTFKTISSSMFFVRTNGRNFGVSCCL